MSIDLFWDNPQQTVLLAEFNGKWSWDELQTMLNGIKRLSRERQMTFGAILDLRHGMHLPGGTIFNREGLQRFQQMVAMSDGDQQGPVVILGMNSVVKMIFDAVANFDRSLVSTVTFADNEAAARRQIYAAVAQLRSAV